jgi:hypothetical protein
MEKSYIVRQVRQINEWSELFAEVEHPHLVQSWPYGEAKKSTGWSPRRLVIERGGEPVALCQVLDERLLGIRFASRISRGPLLLRCDEPDIEGIYRALRQGWRYLIGGLLLIAPALIDEQDQWQPLQAAGFRRWRQNGWSSAYLDLRLTELELRKNLSSKWRNHLGVSERRGLELLISSAPEAVAWIIGQHVTHMQHKGFKGPGPDLLQALYRAAQEDFIVFQACLNGTPVGGVAVFRFGHTAEYYLGWSGPEGRKANAGNFLVWNAAVEMQRRGCRYFDLGSYSKAAAGGYSEFKQAMNGVEYCLLGEWFSLW